MKIYLIHRSFVWYEDFERRTSNERVSAVALIFLDEAKAYNRLIELKGYTEMMEANADVLQAKYEVGYRERCDEHNDEELDFNNAYLTYNAIKELDPDIGSRIGFNLQYHMHEHHVTE